MGELFALFDHFNLSPVNTILLVILVLLVRPAVKGVFQRITTVEQGLAKVIKRNSRQDWAIRRTEEKLGLEPLRYPDDDDED